MGQKGGFQSFPRVRFRIPNISPNYAAQYNTLSTRVGGGSVIDTAKAANLYDVFFPVECLFYFYFYLQVHGL